MFLCYLSTHNVHGVDIQRAIINDVAYIKPSLKLGMKQFGHAFQLLQVMSVVLDFANTSDYDG